MLLRTATSQKTAFFIVTDVKISNLRQAVELIVVAHYRGTVMFLLFNLPSLLFSRLDPYWYEII
jgi:hypothetical protein